MKHAHCRRRIACAALFGLLTLCMGSTCAAEAVAERIVVAGGALTEIVYALGLQGRLAGVDSTSVHPPAARTLPQVGYLRALSAEGVLGLHPDLLLTTTDAGPPATLANIRAGKVRVETIAADYTPEGVAGKIRAVASALGEPGRGETLARRFEAEWQRTAARLASDHDRPRVLFILAHGGGSPQIAGRNTAADAMIRLAGGVNAIDGFSGYRPLTSEGAAIAAPDVLLLTSETVTGMGGIDALWQTPALAHTPAGRQRRAVFLDAAELLGFGPRLAGVVSRLAARLHGGES
jgi:iron complex transport system substrate-binding protein